MSRSKKCASSSSLNIGSIYCSTTCTFLEKSKRSERAFRILEKMIVVSPQKTKILQTCKNRIKNEGFDAKWIKRLFPN